MRLSILTVDFHVAFSCPQRIQPFRWIVDAPYLPLTIFRLTKDDTYGRTLSFELHLVVQGRQVELHLPDVFWKEFPDLKLNCHEGTQAPVIEQQVDEVVLLAHREPVLAAHEGEHSTHLQ